MAQRSNAQAVPPLSGALIVDAADRAEDLLTPAVEALLVELARSFGDRRDALLQARLSRQKELDAGKRRFDFRVDTVAIRQGSWRVAPLPAELIERKVEITGPVDRKMICNALSSGASVFMADFEDSNTPTWSNLVDGQRALQQAARGTLTFIDDKTGKRYGVPAERSARAVLMARPRGLHLPEAHVLVDGRPIPGAFFDAALYVLHNARALLDEGSGPYLYLPKLEAMEEAQLWNDVLRTIENHAGLPHGTVKVTVLIETLPAAFQMDEILHALKERCVGLNCGRWDYIFSTIKRRRRDAALSLPDRGALTMEQHALRSYTRLLVTTCHKRGALALGGMSAFIPRKDDAAKNEAALLQVKKDKLREAGDGHDGTWVAHPGLVAVAREVFDDALRGAPNQLGVVHTDVVKAADLLAPFPGERTEAGLFENVRVAVEYLAQWLSGNGCVPIDFKMEDAATAEISRALLWHWLHAHDGRGELVAGAPLTEARVVEVAGRAEAELVARGLPAARVRQARELFVRMATSPELDEFLTLPAYDALLQEERRPRG